MPTLHAWQHIYANVERDRSPSNRAGFQTLFYSHDGLSKEDVAEIEERVFYVFGENNPVKHVFFRLNSDKVCLGQVAPVPGRDAAGREGLYIAHTLVFSTADFQATNINAPDYFNPGVSKNLFISSLDDAFKQGNPTSGNINPIEITPSASLPTKIPWDQAIFRKLAQLAINHQALSDERAALALTGSPAEILERIASIFLLIPPQIAPYCTFDTFFERGGNLSFTYTWCAGFVNKPRQPVYYVADVKSNHIHEPGSLAAPALAYGRWVDDRLTINNAQDVITNKKEAYEIGHFLDTAHKTAGAKRAPNDLPSSYSSLTSNPELLTSVLAANQCLVRDCTRRQLDAILPKLLTDRIFDVLYSNLSGLEIIQYIATGFKPGPLLPLLFAEYQNESFASPKKEERQALSAVLQKHEHKPLKNLLLIWGGSTWENPITKWRIKAGLEKMNQQEYQGFWQLAVPAGLVDPMDLLVDGKEALFTMQITTSGLLDPDTVPGLVKMLVKTDQTTSLELLLPFLDQLGAKQVRKIKDYIEDSRTVPTTFSRAIEHLLQA